MPDFETPDVVELRDRYLAALKAGLPSQRTGPRTLAHIEAGVAAEIVRDNHARLDEIDRNATPLTATERGLVQWAELLRVPRKAATAARKAQALEVRGTVGAVVPVGTQLVHASGLRYQTTVAITLPSAAVATTDIEAVDVGASTRLPAGEALRFVTAPTGIDQTARLVRDLDEGGEDEEPVGLWRRRVVQRHRVAVQGGTRADYEQWVLESAAAIRDAFVYPNKPTVRSVSLIGLKSGTGAARVLGVAERDAIAAYVERFRPTTDHVVVMQTITRKVHVDVRLATLASAGFDWQEDAAYTVASYNAATRQLVMSPGVPSTMSAGDRLTVVSGTPDSSGADGFPAVVSAVVNGTTVVLAPYGNRSEPLAWTPSAGNAIRPYGDAAEQVRTAILDGRSLGCGGEEFLDGFAQLGPANPGRVYGDWASDVEVARLQVAALSVVGVTGVTVVAPAADVLATEYEFPDDNVVELLVPGQVVVRPA